MAVDVNTRPGDATFHSGIPHRLFAVLPVSVLTTGRYAVAPDGKRFLFALPGTPSVAPPLTVVLNWQSALQ